MAKAANRIPTNVLVLGALGLVLVGVGAFQLTGGGAPAPLSEQPAGEPTTDAAAERREEERITRFVQGILPQRDPFLPSGAVAASPQAQGAPDGFNPAAGQPPAGPVSSNPPMPPMPGDVEPLPMPDASLTEENQGSPDAPSLSAPSYSVSGIVLSDVPVAVIRSGEGRQRVARVGDVVDGMKVRAITRRSVTLVGNGQELVLTLKGDG